MKVYLNEGPRREVNLVALNEVRNTALLKDSEGNLQEIEIQAVILELSDQPPNHKPKSPMKQNRINRVKEYLQEIKDLVENPSIILTSDFDLENLSKAKDLIKAFLQKQQTAV